MATVAIVTDSAASIPDDLAEALGIGVVPFPATAGGRDLGGRRPHAEELRDWLAAGVRTGSPSPGQFLSAIAATGAGEVLVCTITARISATYQAARLAARSADRPVRVLDTGTAAGGEGLVVLAAARAARAGASLDEVAAVATRAAGAVRLTAHVPTLDALVRSGRLPAPVARAAGRLGLQPLFEFSDGNIRPLRPARSAAAARERMLARWRASRRPGATLHVAALHALAPDEAKSLLEAVHAESEPASAFVAEFDLTMVAHTGPGVTGLAWWWEGP